MTFDAVKLGIKNIRFSFSNQKINGNVSKLNGNVPKELRYFSPSDFTRMLAGKCHVKIAEL